MSSLQFVAVVAGFWLANAWSCKTWEGKSLTGTPIDSEYGSLKPSDCCARCYQRQTTTGCAAAVYSNGSCSYFKDASPTRTEAGSITLVYSSDPTPTPGPTPGPPTPAPPLGPDLKADLQTVIDKLICDNVDNCPGLSMGFAWKDAKQEVAVASGQVDGRTATVNDTYLFGSGTKPITAASIMRLIDRGLVKANTPVYSILDPYLKRMGKKSTEEYFGEDFQNARVLDVIRMSAGIRDFEDDPAFDGWVLNDGDSFQKDYPYDAINFSVSADNIRAGGGSGPLICPVGGDCTSYSSTSYVVAGLLLTALLEPNEDWHDFNLGSVLLKDRSKVAMMQFPNGPGKISRFLTVPGNNGGIEIFDQDASILGFTCGNGVGRPSDMALFFYWLLGEEGEDAGSLISRENQAEMCKTRVLTKGWGAGGLWYGAGIQDRYYGGLHSQGHEGATYGFGCSSGYVSQLKGSFSLTVNYEINLAWNPCPLLEVVKRWTTGDPSVSLGCPYSKSDEVFV